MIVGEYLLDEKLRLRKGFLACVVGGLLCAPHDLVSRVESSLMRGLGSKGN